MAVFVGALMIHGVQPGPDIIEKQPSLFWGLVASMWIGNVILLLLNLPLVGLWARLLRLPSDYLMTATLVLCCAGVYSLNRSPVDVLLLGFFGALGFVLRQRSVDPTPILLGYVLGAPLQENWHRALVFAQGDALTFVTHPTALLALVSAAALVLAPLPQFIRRRASTGR